VLSPTSTLDLTEFKKRNGTLIIVSHNMKELAGICDEGTCLDLGRVADTGPIDGIISRYAARVSESGPGNRVAAP